MIFELLTVTFFQDFNEEPAPEPTNEIDSYIDVLECLMRKISSGLSLINMGETFDEALTALRESEVRCIA